MEEAQAGVKESDRVVGLAKHRSDALVCSGDGKLFSIRGAQTPTFLNGAEFSCT